MLKMPLEPIVHNELYEEVFLKILEGQETLYKMLFDPVYPVTDDRSTTKF